MNTTYILFTVFLYYSQNTNFVCTYDNKCMLPEYIMVTDGDCRKLEVLFILHFHVDRLRIREIGSKTNRHDINHIADRKCQQYTPYKPIFRRKKYLHIIG